MADDAKIEKLLDEQSAMAASPGGAVAEPAVAATAASGDNAGAGAEAEPEPLAPIIIKKIIDEGHGGAHGGAWKIALADMMTAMMAFFLLMWLLGASNEAQRKSVADYFKPTALTKSAITVNTTSGSVGLMGGQSMIDDTALPMAATQSGLMQLLTPRDVNDQTENEKEKRSETKEEEKKRISNELDQANFEKLQQELIERLSQDKDLAKLKDQVNFVREKEGLRIEVIDKADFSMFSLGTTKLSPRAKSLIEEIARSLGTMPNKIKVRGHTDSVPYNGAERNNWSLSAERAEVTRQIINGRGVEEKRVARIEGVADTEPFVPENKLDPRNRRISITLMYQDL
jgi:chemotaxis protein MotB